MIKFNFSFIIFLIIGFYSGLIKEISMLLAVIAIHELGHIIMILITKEKIQSMEITAIGCFINIRNNSFRLFKSIMIYSGGIIFNVISLFFINNYTFVKFSKLMLFINLIPITPLDGFQIINVILLKFYEEEFIIDLMFNVGMLINTILIILSVLFKIYFIVCLSLFLYYKLVEYKKAKKYFYLKNYFKLSI